MEHGSLDKGMKSDLILIPWHWLSLRNFNHTHTYIHPTYILRSTRWRSPRWCKFGIKISAQKKKWLNWYQDPPFSQHLCYFFTKLLYAHTQAKIHTLSRQHSSHWNPDLVWLGSTAQRWCMKSQNMWAAWSSWVLPIPILHLRPEKEHTTASLLLLKELHHSSGFSYSTEWETTVQIPAELWSFFWGHSLPCFLVEWRECRWRKFSSWNRQLVLKFTTYGLKTITI